MPDVAAWTEFRRRCLKPDSDRLGTWTARRIARPTALRITWLVAPLGVTAHQATLLAALTALAAMVGFAHGSSLGWLIGAVLLEAWYVLDHVDGQLARRRGTASLDGTTFDYLMHHSVNLLLPTALAYGVTRQTGEPAWCLVGAAWSWGMLLLGLRHDARYKSFIQRLKHLHGTLHVVGGGGGRPTPAAWPQRRLRSVAKWCLLKLYEAHALAHLLLVIAAARLLFLTWQEFLAIATVALPALPAVPLAAYFAARDLRRSEAETQFAAWFRVPEGATLEFRDGHWYVETEPTPCAAAIDRDKAVS
jgi:phosphatidylglycerophosphate synthase